MFVEVFSQFTLFLRGNMKQFKVNNYGVIFLLVVTTCFVTALEPLDNFREGSCSGAKIRPVAASREFVDSLRHIMGGSKSHLYRLASGLPNYSSITEDELYHDACYMRNTSTTVQGSIAATSGFGRRLGTFYITSRPGLYFEGTPTNPAQSHNSVTATVTLTDNKTFAFWVNCFAGADQRGWGLVTHGKISRRAQRLVENHAVSLGFKRENFVFISYDSCPDPYNCSSCHGA